MTDNPFEQGAGDPGDDSILEMMSEPAPADNSQTEDDPQAEAETPVEAEAEPDAEDTDELSDDPDADPAEEGEGEEEPEDQAYFTLPNGDKVTAEEIVEWRDQGLMRKDYSQKTEALANERKEFEASKADMERQATARFDAAMQAIVDLGLMPKPPNPEDFADDDLGWVAAQRDYQAKMAPIAEAMNARQADFQKAQKQQAKDQAAWKQEQINKTLEYIPEWKDRAVAKKDASEMMEVLPKLGFTEDEIKGMDDARNLRLVRLAVKGFKATQSGADIVKEALATKPPVQKPGVTKSSAQQKAADRKALIQRVKDSDGDPEMIAHLL